MTGIVVPPNELGVLRLFRVTLPDHDLARLRAADAAAGTPESEVGPLLSDRLFGMVVQSHWTTILRIEDLGDLRLSDHLMMGEGVPEEVVLPERSRLDGLEGTVVLLLSRAVEGGAAIDTRDASELVQVFRHDMDFAPKAPLRSSAAVGDIAGGTPRVTNPKRQSGMIALYAIVAMMALVLLMVWVAG